MTLDEEDEAAVRQMIMQQRKQSVRRQAIHPVILTSEIGPSSKSYFFMELPWGIRDTHGAHGLLQVYETESL